MNAHERATQSSGGPAGWILPAHDPVWEEQKARLWAMTRDERVRAMRAGKLSLRQCLHWASQRPAEVPLLNNEFEFIAITTPEVADADETPSQRERVTESLIRCPAREPRARDD